MSFFVEKILLVCWKADRTEIKTSSKKFQNFLQKCKSGNVMALGIEKEISVTVNHKQNHVI